MKMDQPSDIWTKTAQKLKALARNSSGLLHSRNGSIQPIHVVKEEGQIRLLFFNPNSGEVESRLDPNNPLMLVSPYTQGMMAGLIWNPEPRHIHILGLGGGRLPMILRHHFPEVQIDCTEIDAEVPNIAREYFGLITDSHLRVIIGDGREYLARRGAQPPYDVIMIDAFSGFGFGSFGLATREFLSLCATQLSETGVVVTNIIADDFLFLRRLKTMIVVFKNVYLAPVGSSSVLFADNGAPMERLERLQRGIAIAQARDFAFPFLPHVENIISLPQILRLYPELQETPVLYDALPPQDLPVNEGILRNVGRNDRCPCGSGKKYKKCHGRSE